MVVLHVRKAMDLLWFRDSATSPVCSSSSVLSWEEVGFVGTNPPCYLFIIPSIALFFSSLFFPTLFHSCVVITPMLLMATRAKHKPRDKESTQLSSD